MMKIDMKKIWEELETMAKKNRKGAEEVEEDKEEEKIETEETIQSEKEDIEEVVVATSLTSENVHGGSEATGDIEDSPNASEKGEMDKNELDDKELEGTEECEDGEGCEEGYGDNQPFEQPSSQPSDEPTDEKDLEDDGNTEIKETGNVTDNTTNDATEAENNSIELDEAPPTTELGELQKNDIREFINKMQEAEFDKPYLYKETDVSSIIVETIKFIAKKYTGVVKGNNNTLYDTRKIAKHLLTCQEFKIPKDKFSKDECREVLFFLDTSGSMDWCLEGICKAIKILENQGFTCTICGAGNGFWEEDSDNDDYNVREELLDLNVGKLAKVVRPSLETAIKMANTAIFSIIVADFDGLSDFVKLSEEVIPDKIPYFLSTEDRYSWDDPTEHDWVDPDYSCYPLERVFPIVEYDDEEYEDDDYDDEEYEDDWE